MADLTLTFADANVGEIRRAYCAAYGWRSQEEDGPRPEFMLEKLREHIRATVLGVREAEAAPAPVVVDDIVGADTGA